MTAGYGSKLPTTALEVQGSGSISEFGLCRAIEDVHLMLHNKLHLPVGNATWHFHLFGVKEVDVAAELRRPAILMALVVLLPGRGARRLQPNRRRPWLLPKETMMGDINRMHRKSRSGR